ncbi:hypothetical protein MMC30_007778 [Trapelia coarctata]|nr:hypothetical protein [Trapelia coarctata]
MSLPTENADSVTRGTFKIKVAEESKCDDLVAIPLTLTELLLQQYLIQLGVDQMEYPKLPNGSRFQEHIDVPGLVTDRPWILATNRRVRHLHGISVRNISFDKTKAPEKKVYDADGIFLGLSDSVSMADPNTAGEAHGDSNDSKNEQLDGSGSSRPSVGSMRRRSTLSWGNVAPDVRQKKLEEVTGSRLADVFFTIYDAEGNEVIYVSETVEKTMNPDFKSFDLRLLETPVTRSSELHIEVWAKPECLDEPVHLVEMKVNMISLRWVCKTMLQLEEPLPPNCILFHLPDGIYTHNSLANFCDFSPLMPSRPFVQHHRVGLLELASACYDSLSKLSIHADCINDAILVRIDILRNIERFLETENPSSEILSLLDTEKQTVYATQAALAEIRRSLAGLEERVEGINVSNFTRRFRMGEGHVFTNKVAERQHAELMELESKKATKDTQAEETRGHVRRVAQILFAVFPITPIEDRPLCFEICGQHLPNADDLYATGKHAPTEQGIAAALGYVARVMTQVADVIGFSFSYPINGLGSQSTIEDPITILPNPSGSSSSTATPKRVFPLYQAGSKRADFEYAVYLLNQDLMGLMAIESMRVVNPKTTLANLKYLMEVLTSGKGDVPKRKKGKNVLEAVGLSKVNVDGEIVKEPSGRAEHTNKAGDTLMDVQNLMGVLQDQMEKMVNTPCGTKELAAAVHGVANSSGAGNASGAVKVRDETAVQGKGKGKGKATAKGKGKEKETQSRPYAAPTVEDEDETGFAMEGPAPAVIPVSDMSQKIDSRTPFSYL